MFVGYIIVPLLAIRRYNFQIDRTGRKHHVNWYDYIGCFFAGAFLANTVPHFVHGISGDRFPTPFASPPGKGLSSPTVNILWALFNLIVGYVLFRIENVAAGDVVTLVIFFVGVAAIGIWLSVRFTKKHKT
jgi:FtsH-binding integral membrane protein